MNDEHTHGRGDGGSDEEDTVVGIDRGDAALPRLVEPGDLEGHTVISSGVGVDAALTPQATVHEPDPEPDHEPDPELVPVTFAIRIGTHAPIPLEVPAYVGRRPSTPRITGTLMPRLVMVPSPSREVSSTHVEIRQEAETVVVTDLGSTNGTTVTIPGNPPRPLRQGESLVVSAGTLVDIGDGIRIGIVKHPEETLTEGPQ